MSDFKVKVHQIWFLLGFRPGPRWESLQRSPDSLAGGKGLAAPSPRTPLLALDPSGLRPRPSGLRPCTLFSRIFLSQHWHVCSIAACYTCTRSDRQLNRVGLSILRSIVVHWWWMVTAGVGLWKHYLAGERRGLSCIMSHVISLSLCLPGW